MNGLAINQTTKRQGSYELMMAGYEIKPACELCGSTKNLVIDHIKPLSQGGDNQPDNLRTLCQSCNVKEGWEYRERANGDFIKYTTYLPLETIKELKRYALDNDQKDYEVMQEAVSMYLKAKKKP
jgi:5-methylcytosine-specific restriction endonuclease McrA